MSLNNSKYLKPLDSEQSQYVPAVYYSVSIQKQLDQIRTDLSLLTDVISQLVELHDREHPDSCIIGDDTPTDMLELLAEHAEVLPPATATTAPKSDSPYL